MYFLAIFQCAAIWLIKLIKANYFQYGGLFNVQNGGMEASRNEISNFFACKLVFMQFFHSTDFEAQTPLLRGKYGYFYIWSVRTVRTRGVPPPATPPAWPPY